MQQYFKLPFLLALSLGMVSCIQNKGVAPGSTTSSEKKVLRTFVTSNGGNGYDSGDLGGAQGADSKCSAEATIKGLQGTYQALLASAVRTACTTAFCSNGAVENQNWVLKSDTEYYREDGTTLIAKTNSEGIFTFPVTASISGAGETFYTGLNLDWTTSSHNCLNWQSSSHSNGGGADVGNAGSLTDDSISSGGSTYSCSSGMDIQILCVEQPGAGANPGSEPAPFCSTCKIFVTTASYNGNLGGINGADAKCMMDGQVSSGETYKALLGNRGSDWPIHNGATYTKLNGQTVAIANGVGQFVFPLNSPVGMGNPWTGLASNWANFNTCSSWTSASGSANSNTGDASATSTSFLNSTIPGCDTLHPLYCIQQ